MTLGGTAIFVIVTALAVFALAARRSRRDWMASNRFILLAGLLIPTLLLTALLYYGLILPGPMPGHHAPATP